MADIVNLVCKKEAISDLAVSLSAFGALDGEPGWLISAVWLQTQNAQYLATTSTTVLSDGFIARPLVVERTDDFVTTLSCELPDISARLAARRSSVRLPDASSPSPPSLACCWDRSSYSTTVLVWNATRPTRTHRVACALLLESANQRLLVGTDPATPSMVLNQDRDFIDRYTAQCDRILLENYLDDLA